MTDKVQKIREGVEKLKSQLIRGACSSQIAMETHCKEEAYNEVISLLDSLQEEPEPQFKVGDTIRSKHWNTAVHKIISMDDKSYCLDNGGKVDLLSQQLWELVEEPVSEDFKKFEEQYLEKEKDEIISVYDRHAGLVDGAQWQKEQFEKDYTNLCKGIVTVKGFAVTMAYDKGMADAREKMMAKAVDATLLNGNLIKQKHTTHPLHVGDKVKVIVIKED